MERSIRFSGKATLGVCGARLELHLEGDIDIIERLQRRETRIPTGFEKLEYEGRLKRLSLTTLQVRRMRGDLIET